MIARFREDARGTESATGSGDGPGLSAPAIPRTAGKRVGSRLRCNAVVAARSTLVISAWTVHATRSATRCSSLVSVSVNSRRDGYRPTEQRPRRASTGPPNRARFPGSRRGIGCVLAFDAGSDRQGGERE